MSEEMKKNVRDEELNKEQLEGVAGGDRDIGGGIGGGMGGGKDLPPLPTVNGTKKVNCKCCGAVNEVPIAAWGYTTCTSCGKEFKM